MTTAEWTRRAKAKVTNAALSCNSRAEFRICNTEFGAFTRCGCNEPIGAASVIVDENDVCNGEASAVVSKARLNDVADD